MSTPCTERDCGEPWLRLNNSDSISTGGRGGRGGRGSRGGAGGSRSLCGRCGGGDASERRWRAARRRWLVAVGSGRRHGDSNEKREWKREDDALSIYYLYTETYIPYIQERGHTHIYPDNQNATTKRKKKMYIGCPRPSPPPPPVAPARRPPCWFLKWMDSKESVDMQ